MPTPRVPKGGSNVVFSGLIGRKHLNGLTGTVIPHIDGSLEDETHRCRVQVHGSNHTVKVLARNITLLGPDSAWGLANRLNITAAPEDTLTLPTAIPLNIDKGQYDPGKVQQVRDLLDGKPPGPKKASNRICTAKGQQPLGETYADIQKSAAGRDPGRIRHMGLGFFKDSLEEEAHPGCGKVRVVSQAKGTSKYTRRQGYDWRRDALPRYTDPSRIPVDQGGHAAHVCVETAANKDAAEGERPMHPRLRGLLMDEEMDPEEVYEPPDFHEMHLFTDEKDFAKLKATGGPLRKAAQKEREFKKKEIEKTRLLRERVALSIRPADARTLPPVASWKGRTIDAAGTWDPMACDMRNPMMEADSGDGITLEYLMNRRPDKGHIWEATSKEDGMHVHQAGRDSPPPQSVLKEAPAKSEWSIPEYVSHRLRPGSPVLDKPPPQPEEITPAALLIPNPWTEEVIQEMLAKSEEDAEKGFDYGRSWTHGRRPSVGRDGDFSEGEDEGAAYPWYESLELASSYLAMDADIAASANAEAGGSGDQQGSVAESAGISEAVWSQIHAAAAVAPDAGAS